MMHDCHLVDVHIYCSDTSLARHTIGCISATCLHLPFDSISESSVCVCLCVMNSAAKWWFMIELNPIFPCVGLWAPPAAGADSTSGGVQRQDPKGLPADEADAGPHPGHGGHTALPTMPHRCPSVGHLSVRLTPELYVRHGNLPFLSVYVGGCMVGTNGQKCPRLWTNFLWYVSEKRAYFCMLLHFFHGWNVKIKILQKMSEVAVELSHEKKLRDGFEPRSQHNYLNHEWPDGSVKFPLHHLGKSRAAEHKSVGIFHISQSMRLQRRFFLSNQTIFCCWITCSYWFSVSMKRCL